MSETGNKGVEQSKNGRFKTVSKRLINGTETIMQKGEVMRSEIHNRSNAVGNPAAQ